MIKITLSVGGMACGMCEAHINDAIRRAFSVKKVTSSHTRGETVILADTDIRDDDLCAAIGNMGYVVNAISREPYEKKGLFARFRK